jgi:Sel1 repeat
MPLAQTLVAIAATLHPFASIARAEDVAGERAEVSTSIDASSAQARIWFERGLALDLGIEGPPDPAQAFVAMKRAADAGHAEAAFNVAAMLDSGRGVPRDVDQAAVWYARAAAGGNRRAAFNLGQLYERGEGVPANADLSREWYRYSNLPAGRDRLARANPIAGRPKIAQAPQPLFPLPRDALDPSAQQADLVWTTGLDPEPVRFFVELRSIDANSSREIWSGFVDTSSVRLPLPQGAQTLAWRVTAVAESAGAYASSSWSSFAVP